MGQAGREGAERGDERAPGDQDARRLPRQDLVLRPQLRQDHRHGRARGGGERSSHFSYNIRCSG